MAAAQHPVVEVGSVQGDLSNTDRSTAQTIAVMCGHIHTSAFDPLIVQAAENCGVMFRRDVVAGIFGTGSAERGIACGCWWFAKTYLRFKQDSDLLLSLLNKRDELELLISPDVMIRAKRKEGDCDDFTMFVCALLEARGIPWEIVTVACDPSDPARFSHVYPRAVLADGSRLSLDASHGKYPGWCVPAAHVSRLQVWDEQGQAIPDHDQRSRPMGAYVRRRPITGLFGLGPRGFAGISGGLGDMVCDETGCYDDGSSSVAPPAPISAPPAPITTGPAPASSYYDQFGNLITPLPGGGYTSTNSSGSATLSGSLPSPAPGQSVTSAPGNNSWASALASIVGNTENTVKGLLQPTTTVTLPNGQVVTAPAGSLASQQLIGSVTGIGGTTWLLIGGGLLLAFALMGGGGRR